MEEDQDAQNDSDEEEATPAAQVPLLQQYVHPPLPPPRSTNQVKPHIIQPQLLPRQAPG